MPLGRNSPLGEFPRAFGAVALLKPLSQDERGEVYIALRPDGVDRLCVVNVLPASVAASPALVDALQAEASWLVGRVHGNLVQIYDVGQTGDRFFLVNELVEGGDLGHLIMRTASRPGGIFPEVAAFIALEFADAVDYLRHTEERDTGIRTSLVGLSASSLMVSREGHLKLMHPGSCLALHPSRQGETDSLRVSLIAPEHVDGGGSVAGDIYAVGALLWHILTGKPLAGNHGARHLELLRSGLFVPRAPSSVVGPDRIIPLALDTLVTAALAPGPRDRPRDFEAMRAALAAIVRAIGGDPSQRLRTLVAEVFGRDLQQQSDDLARMTGDAERALQDGVSSRTPAVTMTNFEQSRKPIGLTRDSDLVLGQVIPGTRYRAMDKLGEGGMGAVYAAEHVDIERRVALKLLHGELSQNPIVLRQFRQEARAASRIGNPYICDVTDWGEVADGRVFFVMEYLDGQSLGRVLKQRRRLPPVRAIPILRQVAKALGAAHEKGIVHLDVKPDNVLLLNRDGKNDRVKVVDFGVAGLLGQSSGAAKVMGTPEYMAPERATGKGYDHRSDIYSLGVMAYEMLVGEVPFQGGTPVETLAMQAADLPDRINERLTRPIPEPIEAVVMSMLEKDAAKRPQSMADVEALLCEAQLNSRLRTAWDDLPIPMVEDERSARIARRLSPTLRKTRLWVGGASTVALLCVATAVYFAVKAQEVGVRNRLPDAPRVAEGSPPASHGNLKIDVLKPSSPGAGPRVVSPTTPPSSPLAVREKRSLSGAAEATQRPRSNFALASASGRRREETVFPSELDPASGREPGGVRRLMIAARQAFDKGDLSKARENFAAVEVIDPKNADAATGLAEVLFEQGDYNKALKKAEDATRLAPRNLRAWLTLGNASYRQMRLKQAEAAYQKALQLAPGDQQAQVGLDLVRKNLTSIE